MSLIISSLEGPNWFVCPVKGEGQATLGAFTSPSSQVKSHITEQNYQFFFFFLQQNSKLLCILLQTYRNGGRVVASGQKEGYLD